MSNFLLVVFSSAYDLVRGCAVNPRFFAFFYATPAVVSPDTIVVQCVEVVQHKRRLIIGLTLAGLLFSPTVFSAVTTLSPSTQSSAIVTAQAVNLSANPTTRLLYTGDTS